MPKLNRKILLTAASIAVVLLLAVVLCVAGHSEKREQQTILLFPTLPQEWILAFEEAYPDRDILLRGNWQLSTFLNDMHAEAVLAYELQAEPLIASGGGYHWTPLGKTAVVIAVDRDQTDLPVSSWRDLAHPELILGMTHEMPEAGLILASLSHGLDGDELQTGQTVALLEQKYRQNALHFYDETAPAQLLLDYHALALIEEGRNLELILPAEGGLVFELGLLSRSPFAPPPQVLACFENSSVLPNSEDGLRSLNLTPPKDPKALNTALLFTAVRLDKEIAGTHRYTTVTGIGYTLPALACIIVFVLWIIATRRRIMQKSASNAIVLVGVSMMLWLTVRLLKWQFPIDSVENRVLWYSFYPFMMLMTASFLWLSTSLGKPEDTGRPPRWWWLLTGVQGLLLVLVYTNDWHRLVFRFDLSSLYWSTVYGYGPGFIPVYASYMLPLLIGVIILCAKCWNSPRRVRILLPLSVLALMVTYAVGYIFKVPVAHNSDITLLTCLFVMVFSESALRTGLIPRNTKYRELFHRSALEMQLLGRDGQTVLSAADAKELPEDIRDRLLSMSLPAELQSGRDTLWFADGVAGGTAVWREDISEIARLKHELAAASIRLKEADRLLEHEKETKDEAASLRASEEIYDAMDREAGSWLREIQRLVAEPMPADKRRGLQEIRLLSIYIKRRCYFLFYAEQTAISADAAADAIGELLEVGEAMGVKSVLSVSLTGEIPIPLCLLLYDFVFYALRRLCEEASDLILHCRREQDRLLCTVIASTELGDFPVPEKLRQGLTSGGARLSHKQLEGAQSLTLDIPCRPEEGGTPDA